jgi:hypothetical protein
MLLNLVTSSLGRLARKKEYDSNLFHFFDRFPLVSSENMTIGSVRVCLPPAATLLGCGVQWKSISWIKYEQTELNDIKTIG